MAPVEIPLVKAARQSGQFVQTTIAQIRDRVLGCELGWLAGIVDEMKRLNVRGPDKETRFSAPAIAQQSEV